MSLEAEYAGAQLQGAQTGRDPPKNFLSPYACPPKNFEVLEHLKSALKAVHFMKNQNPYRKKILVKLNGYLIKALMHFYH